MKKLIRCCLLAGLMTAGLRGGEKGSVETTLLTKEVQQTTFGGYIFAYGGSSFLNNDLSGTGGANLPLAIDTDNGFILGGGFGIRSSALGGIRFEWEHLLSKQPTGSHRFGNVNDVGEGNFSFSGTYANLLKEIHFHRLPSVIGYMGGGIGYAEVDIDHSGTGMGLADSDAALSYQLIAGADYHLCDNVALFLQYKAINLGETDYIQNPVVTTAIGDFWTHNLVAGVRLSADQRPHLFSKNDVFANDCYDGGYIFAYGGGSFLNNDISGMIASPAFPLSVDTGDGFIFGGGVGVRHSAFGGMRFEWENFFSELPAESRSVAGVGRLFAGDLSFTGAYANLLKEIRLDSHPTVTGYIGGGIGYADVDVDYNPIGFPNQSDSDTALSYQLIAGADYNLSNNLALFLQYKAINVGETDYRLGGVDPVVFNDFWSHNLVAGLRLSAGHSSAPSAKSDITGRERDSGGYVFAYGGGAFYPSDIDGNSAPLGSFNKSVVTMVTFWVAGLAFDTAP